MFIPMDPSVFGLKCHIIPSIRLAPATRLYDSPVGYLNIPFSALRGKYDKHIYAMKGIQGFI